MLPAAWPGSTRWSPLDLVAANAGAGAALGRSPVSWEAIAQACRVSFVAAAATVTAVLPRMVARRRGHVVGPRRGGRRLEGASERSLRAND